MYSTERKVLMEILNILRREGLGPHQLADELSLLTVWAAFSRHRHGDVRWHEAQPDLRYAFARIAEEFGEAGRVFESSWLPDGLSGAACNSIAEHLDSLSGSSSQALAKALCGVVEELKGSNKMITSEMGRLLAEFCDQGEQNVTLHYEGSVPALLALGNEKNAAITIRVLSAYPIAVSYLVGAYLKFEDPVGSKIPPGSAGFVISVPPLQGKEPSGTSKLKSDELGALKAARECSTRAIVNVAPSVLFSRNAMTVREELINNNLLDAVIGLPGGSLLNTGVPPVLLLIDKNRQKEDPVAFIEADVPQTEEEFESLVSAVKDKNPSGRLEITSVLNIKKNDYDLSIKTYKPGPATKKLAQLDSTVSLDGVSEIVRAQSLKDADESEDATVFLEASVRDITESGRMGTPEKQMCVDKKQHRRAQNQRLYTGDILLAIKGSVGRVAFVDDSCGENWIAGQAFLIIRPKGTTVSTSYLYRYLTSELIQEYIRETATGSVMALLKAADVSDIPVPLPSLEKREAVESIHQQILAEYDAIQEHRDKICRLEQQNWPLDGSKGADSA